jgi:hypothetical protein
VVAKPGLGGEGGSGEKDLVLGLEPGHCLLVFGGPLRSGARPGRGEGDRLTHRVQQGGSPVGGVQVVVEGPADGFAPFGLGVGVTGLGGGVSPEQVVEGVPAGGVLGDQVDSGQLAQQPAGLGLACSSEAGGGWDGDVGAGVQAEQPEHPR